MGSILESVVHVAVGLALLVSLTLFSGAMVDPSSASTDALHAAAAAPDDPSGSCSRR